MGRVGLKDVMMDGVLVYCAVGVMVDLMVGVKVD